MADWVNDFEHESVTDTNREAFTKAMSKYETAEDAIVGGFNVQTGMGKPYRVPETLDGLDDAGKADFTTKAHKLLGIEHAKDLDSLKDVNLKKGLPDGSDFDEGFANAFKQFVVDNRVPKSLLEPLAEFFNLASIKAGGDYKAKQATDFAAAKLAAENALVAHPDFGSKEKVDEQTVLLHRALTGNLDLSTEEANDVAEFLSNREGATNPTIRRVLLKQLAPLAAEGITHSGDGTGGGAGGTKQLSPYEAKKERWPKSPPSEWGKPTDTWSDMDIQTKKALGYKEG